MTSPAPALPLVVQAVVGSEDVVVPRLPADERATIDRLPSGTRVVLCDSRPGSRRLLRSRARRLGIDVVEEYCVLPSWDRPVFLFASDPAVVHWGWTHLVTVPPGLTRLHAVASVVVRIGAARWCAALICAAAPSRMLVGRRP